MANQIYLNALVESADWSGRPKILTIWGGVKSADLMSVKMYKMTQFDIIHLIRATRVEKGLKQTDMAEMLNMNLLAYQRLEQGKTQLPVFRMLQIFNLLGIEIKLSK
jgi:DNA-binding XRE family transcriptional regulator